MFNTSLSVLSVKYVTAQLIQPLKDNAYLIHLLFARIKNKYCNCISLEFYNADNMFMPWGSLAFP